MNTDIAISLIGFAGVCVGALFGYMGKTKKHAIQQVQREQEQRDLLKEIMKRLDEHNHYAEKIGSITLDIASIKKDIEYIRKDLK